MRELKINENGLFIDGERIDYLVDFQAKCDFGRSPLFDIEVRHYESRKDGQLVLHNGDFVMAGFKELVNFNFTPGEFGIESEFEEPIDGHELGIVNYQEYLALLEETVKLGKELEKKTKELNEVSRNMRTCKVWEVSIDDEDDAFRASPIGQS